MAAASTAQADVSGRIQLALGIVAIVASVAVPALAGNPYWTHTFHLVNLYIAVAVLQNMLLADAGQVSFGQGAVFGAAAYTVGIAAGLHGLPFIAAAACGLVAALALCSLFALPALRVQGYYLGFVTLSVAMVFPEMLVSFNAQTNGINGITLRVPALNRPLISNLTPLSLLVIALACATLVGHALLRRTRLGRRMRIAAASPEAALTLGFSPGHVRSIAFVVAALGTALAGVLYVPVVGFLSPSAFHLDLSIFFFFAVIVGGRGQMLGPVLGVWILYLIPNVAMVGLVNYRLVGYGLVALLIMLLFPDGLVGTAESHLRRLLQTPGGTRVGVHWLIDRMRKRAATDVGAGRDSGTGGATAAVELSAARVAYGSVVALDGIDLSVASGTIHGLVGPNGSGKTTLLNVISGLARLDSGRLFVRGRSTAREPPYRLARLGLGRTFQTPRVFDDLSVWENVQAGADFHGARRDGASLFAALDDVRAEWRAQRPDALPHAQRRLLEVLRVVAMDCDVLLLDEPAAGLSVDERREFGMLLEHLRSHLGKTIILVEHDLDLVWRVADRITVLDAGAIVAAGTPAAIVSDPRVRALFTGRRDA